MIFVPYSISEACKAAPKRRRHSNDFSGPALEDMEDAEPNDDSDPLDDAGDDQKQVVQDDQPEDPLDDAGDDQPQVAQDDQPKDDSAPTGDAGDDQPSTDHVEQACCF